MSDGCRNKKRPASVPLVLALALAAALCAPPARGAAIPPGIWAGSVRGAAGSDGLAGWSPSLEVQAGLYGAIPNASYLNDRLQMRTQGVFKVCVDILAFSFGRVRLGNDFVFAYTTPSLVYNQTRLKDFHSFGGRISLSVSLSRAYRLGLGFEYGYCHAAADVQFAYVGGLLLNEFLLGGAPLCDVLLTAPLEADWRKDIVALSLSVGLCLRFKPPAYEAGVHQRPLAASAAGGRP